MPDMREVVHSESKIRRSPEDLRIDGMQAEVACKSMQAMEPEEPVVLPRDLFSEAVGSRVIPTAGSIVWSGDGFVSAASVTS